MCVDSVKHVISTSSLNLKPKLINLNRANSIKIVYRTWGGREKRLVSNTKSKNKKSWRRETLDFLIQFCSKERRTPTFKS